MAQPFNKSMLREGHLTAPSSPGQTRLAASRPPVGSSFDAQALRSGGTSVPLAELLVSLEQGSLVVGALPFAPPFTPPLTPPRSRDRSQ